VLDIRTDEDYTQWAIPATSRWTPTKRWGGGSRDLSPSWPFPVIDPSSRFAMLERSVKPAVFTGDALFTNGVGRADLHANAEAARERARALYKTATIRSFTNRHNSG
jgi:hypothetical protein